MLGESQRNDEVAAIGHVDEHAHDRLANTNSRPVA